MAKQFVFSPFYQLWKLLMACSIKCISLSQTVSEPIQLVNSFGEFGMRRKFAKIVSDEVIIYKLPFPKIVVRT